MFEKKKRKANTDMLGGQVEQYRKLLTLHLAQFYNTVPDEGSFRSAVMKLVHTIKQPDEQGESLLKEIAQYLDQLPMPGSFEYSNDFDSIDHLSFLVISIALQCFFAGVEYERKK